MTPTKTQTKGRVVLDGLRAGEVGGMRVDQSSAALGALVESFTLLSAPPFRRGEEVVPTEYGLVGHISAGQGNRIDVVVTRPPLAWPGHGPIFSPTNLEPGAVATLGDGEVDTYVRNVLLTHRGAPGNPDGPEDDLARASGRFDLVRPEFSLILVAPEAIAAGARAGALEFLRSLAVELDCLVLIIESRAGSQATAVPLGREANQEGAIVD
jgi:hypothetical protein